ncbi:MAG: tetratricopeptide repeat protein [Candidatus Obscuribacterales bacterium]|nr:tetratricopeptide repeat protein [Candidatus Obscuribacterales bacterium]
MFSHRSDFALACLYFTVGLLAMLCFVVAAPFALRPFVVGAIVIFVTTAFMEFGVSPALPSKQRWCQVSRVISLLLPTPFLIVALLQGTIWELGVCAVEVAALPRVDSENCDSEELACRTEAECLERRGSYYEAEKYYRRWIELRQKSHPGECLDGVLARILDLQGCHSEADQYYSNFEQHILGNLNTEKYEKQVTTGSPVISGIETLPAVLADGRLLRILQTIPREAALHEFDYAGEILKCATMPASEIGLRVSILDLRPVVKDFRKCTAAPKTEENTDNLPEDIDEDCTIITSIETTGKVLLGQTMRRALSAIGQKKALAEFDFADDFYPTPGARFIRENYSRVPLSGYKNIVCVRDLIPQRIAIIDDSDFEKLQKMSGIVLANSE